MAGFSFFGLRFSGLRLPGEEAGEGAGWHSGEAQGRAKNLNSLCWRFDRNSVNKFVAHTDAHRHKIKQPTYRELDQAIAVVHKLYRKYALLLAGKSYQLDNPNPSDLIRGDYEDYKSYFERPWKVAE